jgi:hypothetical protein
MGPGAERAGKARRTGALLLAAFVVLAGGLGYFLLWAGGQSQKLGADLCPEARDFRPPKLIVLLFDQTDRLTRLHRAALEAKFRALIHDEFESAEAQDRWQFTRIEIYSFRGVAAGRGAIDLTRRLALCNPGGVTALTKWIKNPEQVRRQFENDFKKQVETILDGLMTFDDAPQSPILEAIKEVGLKVFADPRYRQSERHLVVASDLIHNTPDLSMFRAVPRHAEFARTPYGQRMAAELKGVRLRAWVFTTAASAGVGRDRLALFWAAYFAAGGVDRRADDVPFEAIP